MPEEMTTIIAEMQDQIAELQRQNMELRKLPDLLERFLKLKAANLNRHLWITPDEDGKTWVVGWYDYNQDEYNNCDGMDTPTEALQWVLDNFPIEHNEP